MTEQPPVSVVVPTRGRPEALRTCLASLAALAYPRSRVQVIVVDDGPQAPAIVEDSDVVVVRTSSIGPAGARNAGVERAEGAALAFVDDDCRPRADWLARMVGRWRDAPEHAVGGRTVNALGTSLCAEAAQLVIDVGYAQNAAPDRRWFTTNNLLVPAEGFRALGGFDATYRTAEDRDFCEPGAVVEHAREMDLAGFAALHFRYGRGAFRFHRDRRRHGSPVALEPSYYAALAREAMQRSGPGRAAALEGLLLVWHAANTAGFVYEWGRSRLNRPSTTAIL
jgi:glycosyltransferase involved in cell wall biosynthesis